VVHGARVEDPPREPIAVLLTELDKEFVLADVYLLCTCGRCSRRRQRHVRHRVGEHPARMCPSFTDRDVDLFFRVDDDGGDPHQKRALLFDLGCMSLLLTFLLAALAGLVALVAAVTTFVARDVAIAFAPGVATRLLGATTAPTAAASTTAAPTTSTAASPRPS